MNWRRRRGRSAVARAEKVRVTREKAVLLVRIQDVCLDLDVWLDRRTGETYSEVLAEFAAGDRSLVALQGMYARLLRRASLRGAAQLQEVLAS